MSGEDEMSILRTDEFLIRPLVAANNALDYDAVVERSDGKLGIPSYLGGVDLARRRRHVRSQPRRHGEGETAP